MDDASRRLFLSGTLAALAFARVIQNGTCPWRRQNGPMQNYQSIPPETVTCYHPNEPSCLIREWSRTTGFRPVTGVSPSVRRADR